MSSRKHRIAIVSHALWPPVGGLPTMSYFLYRAITDSGRYTADLINLATSGDDSASVRLSAPQTWLKGPQLVPTPWRGLQYTHAGAWFAELEFMRYLPRRRLTHLLREYDLVQFVAGSASWVSVAAGADRPIVLWTATTQRADRASRIEKDSGLHKVVASAMLPIAERFELHGLRAASAVFALSDYTQATVGRITGGLRPVVAPCGIDIRHFTPSESPPQPYMLCVARLSDPRKNVHLLLEAYAAVLHGSNSLPDLYLVGDPPSTSAQELIRSMGLDQKVHLLGAKQGDELRDLFRNASLFVLSSDEEGLGIVILEAMASGLAVVSTACGGPETAVAHRETGLLTPVGDAGALAAAIQELVSNPSLRQSMGRAGRRRVEEHFSFEAASRVFLEKYDQLLGA